MVKACFITKDESGTICQEQNGSSRDVLSQDVCGMICQEQNSQGMFYHKR